MNNNTQNETDHCSITTPTITEIPPVSVDRESATAVSSNASSTSTISSSVNNTHHGNINTKSENHEGSDMNAIVPVPSNSNNSSSFNNVFQNTIISTTTSLVSTLLGLTLYPLLKPIQTSSFMLTSSLSFIQRSTMSIAELFFVPSNLLLSNNNNNNGENKQSNTTRIMIENNEENEEENNSNDHYYQNYDENCSNVIQDIAFNTVPIIYNTTQEIICSSLSFFFENNEGGNVEKDEMERVTISKVVDEAAENESRIGSEAMTDDEDEYIPLLYDDMKDEQQQQLDEEKKSVNEQHGIIDSITAEIQLKPQEIILKHVTSKSESEEEIEDGETQLQISKMEHENDIEQSIQHHPPFYIRVCDLNIYSQDNKMNVNDEKINPYSEPNSNNNREEKKEDNVVPEKKLEFLELKISINTTSISTPHHMNLVQMTNTMVQMGIKMAMGGSRNGSRLDITDDEISWKCEGSTAKLLKRFQTSYTNEHKWFTNNELVETLEKEVLLWSGTSEYGVTVGPAYGDKIPLFRGRGIIPSMGPRELTELLLDSSKVKMYNKFSNGRLDAAIFQSDLDLSNGVYGTGCTKIVSSETNVPLSSKKLKMENLFHARRITFDDHDNGTEGSIGKVKDAYIIVSRSVERVHELSNQQKQAKKGSKNEIIWGVNILRDIPGHPDKTDLITVTQANTSAIPNFLSHKVGLMCAGDFFRNIRNM